MKIAVDVLSIRKDGSAGGATGFALELIKGFAAVSGVQVMVLCADWNIDLLKNSLPGNVQFCQVIGDHKFTGIARIDRWINRIIRRFRSGALLARNKVDILYCPFSAPTYKEKGIPTVSTILDIQHEYYPQFFEPQEFAHRRKFYQEIVKKVERVACISDYTKETFCEKYGFPLEKAQTIYIAIQNRFSVEDETVLDRFKLRDESYIVFPANFWEHKNHKLLLNAFAMYANKRRDMKLVLTGNPLEQAEYYNSLLKAMKIDDLTVITGYLTNEELYSILKNSRGLIFPSLFEGFGIPVVEAMYLHKLIACSNLTSLPEIGCDAICYFNPCKPDDILRGIEFLAENTVTEEIIEQYDQKLEEYKPEKMVQEYLTLFQDVIEHKGDLVFQEEVTGIYPDGWSGKEITIQLKEREGSKITGNLLAPDFLENKLKISIKHGNDVRQEIILPGQSVKLEEVIDNDHFMMTITTARTWCPQTVLKSEDSRQLGVMVEKIVVEMKDGQVQDLKEMII